MLWSRWLFNCFRNYQLIIESRAKCSTMAINQIGPIPRPKGPEEYPFYFDFPSVPPRRVCLEMFQRRHVVEVRKIWKGASSEGNGLGQEEDFGHVEENMADPRYTGAVLVDVMRGEVMAAVLAFPSYLCRSEHPVLAGGLLLVSHTYRGSGVAAYMASINHVHSQHQYEGVLGRISVTAKSIKAALESSKHFKIPELIKRENSSAKLPISHRQSPIRDQSTLQHHSLGTMKITLADTAELWQIQDIIRSMALAGEGFGLDEFTADGVYNEKLIEHCCYRVVRKTKDGELVAVILSGDSGLCRSLNKEQAAGAVIVLEPFRRQGLGNQLVEWCEGQGQACGYKAILTDVLACSAAGLGLLRKRGFLITGTLIRSCIVGGRYTDSYVLWKLLKHGLYPTSSL